MWVFAAGYCVFYVLTLIHLRRITARTAKTLRLDIHRIHAEVLRDLGPTDESAARLHAGAMVLLDAVLTKLEQSPPLYVYLQALWLTPIVVVSELLGSDTFEKSYAEAMREILIDALRKALAILYSRARRRRASKP